MLSRSGCRQRRALVISNSTATESDTASGANESQQKQQQRQYEEQQGREGFDPFPFIGLDYYQILGVPVGATRIEIRRAYRHLQKTYHPDIAGEEVWLRGTISRSHETERKALSMGIERHVSDSGMDSCRAFILSYSSS